MFPTAIAFAVRYMFIFDSNLVNRYVPLFDTRMVEDTHIMSYTSPVYLAPLFLRFSTRKNIHLVWMSRDGGMVALFENQVWVQGRNRSWFIAAWLLSRLHWSPFKEHHGNVHRITVVSVRSVIPRFARLRGRLMLSQEALIFTKNDVR